MRHRHPLLLILAAALAACGGEPGATAPTAPPPPPPPPPPTVLLKDIVVSRLPSPYYHFEYDAAGRIEAASFASGLTMYHVSYDGGRITEMRNNTLGNQDRLRYHYDDAGRVGVVDYVDSRGQTYTRVVLSYDGQKLATVERLRKFTSGFVTEKTTSLSYYPDGNLLELTEHRPHIDGRQDETTTVDHFEQYDDGINVDGFALLHDDFFDHLVLLPGVQLQKGNPGVATRTGDGLNFTVHFFYTYDGSGRPRAANGDVTLLNGPDAGQTVHTLSEFTYY